MEIVFFWVHNYLDKIVNQGYNLGSEYFFSVVRQPTGLLLKSEENKSFIPDYWHRSINDTRLVNMTALVGENGAGKSMTFDFLREILKPFPFDNRRSPHHIIVFKDQHGDYFFYSTSDCLSERKEIHPLQAMPRGSHDIIFNTPIVSSKFSFSIFGGTDDIDVSTRSLIYKDWHDYDENSKEGDRLDDPLHPFILKNTQRQSEFLSKFKETKEFFKDKHVEIAEGVFISFQRIAESRVKQKDLADYDNLPTEIKIFLKDLYNYWDEQRRIDRKFKNPKDVSQKRELLLREFKLSTVLALAYHLDKNNKFLREITLPGKQKTFFGFDDAFDFFMESLIEKAEGGSKQTSPDNIKVRDVIEPLVTTYEAILKNLDSDRLPEDVSSDNKIDVKYADHNMLLNEYARFGLELIQLNRMDAPEFISFEPATGLSAGEQAFIDLFARIYSGLQSVNIRKDILQDKYEVEKPFIYILIDEGELGFHLRWQRDYVSDLCKFLPKIFELSDLECKFQVIFSTHSPISLSDMPHSHVIYLTKDRPTGKISTDESFESLTFGANIQSLMAHSFFLEKGAVGEFAKHQIQKLINTLQVGKNFKAEEVFDESPMELKKRTEMIGEPFLRDKLMEMLFANPQFGDQLRIEALEEELKLKGEELNRLKNKE